jgi:hypothetical protein
MHRAAARVMAQTLGDLHLVVRVAVGVERRGRVVADVLGRPLAPDEVGLLPVLGIDRVPGPGAEPVRPGPPVNVSPCPSSALIRSLPGPPSSLSDPPWPSRSSFPPPPRSVSLPDPPMSRSLPGLPITVLVPPPRSTSSCVRGGIVGERYVNELLRASDRSMSRSPPFWIGHVTLCPSAWAQSVSSVLTAASRPA